MGEGGSHLNDDWTIWIHWWLEYGLTMHFNSEQIEKYVGNISGNSWEDNKKEVEVWHYSI